MARIAVGGFQHETNTFAPARADLAAFRRPGAWPGMVEGPELFEAVAGINLPVAGFIEQAGGAGHRLVPTAWASATPSAEVTDHAFEHIAGRLLAGIREALPLDAVYLCLHGAMVTDSLQDGEGALLQRVRALIGDRVALVASLDFHANVSPAMIAAADALVAFRTYPHIDMAETGAQAARLLDRILADGPPAKAYRQLPFLIPLTRQCTTVEPMASLYALLASLEAADGTALSFTPGFPLADIHDCGPAVFGYGPAPGAAVARLAEAAAAREGEFVADLPGPDAAVRRALSAARPGGPPVVIADVQDNSGGGGNSDTTGLLRALVRQRAEGAALGLMVDTEAARAAHAAGMGAEIHLGLGGKSGVAGDAPFQAGFRVAALSDGRFRATGPVYAGSRMQLGPSARLTVNGVDVVVASAKVQLADQAMYRFVGVEPTERPILVNKSSVHYRADFAPIAAQIIECAAPGPVIADPAALNWTRLRPGVRIAAGG